ncbi:MAG: ABC transporter permease [Bacteroidetes bacterium]|nr:ABC transporter permease [Bacteroidota bacterium]
MTNNLLNVPFYIAKRYLFSKRSRNVVHLISYVSMLGVAVGTAALVIVLSVFNGFEDLVLSLYNAFDPAIKITAVEGKVFEAEEVKELLDEKNILYSEVLEEKVLLKYEDKEYIAKLKGVDANFKKLNSVDSMLVVGDYFEGYKANNTAIVGQGVAYYLSMGVGDMMNPLQVFVPKRESKHLLKPETAFAQRSLVPVGVFAIQADFDANYVIASLDFVRELLNRTTEVSAIEVACSNAEMEVLQAELQQILGAHYQVQNRYQQHAFLHKILHSEKLAVFLILTFILIIATFNIIGSLSMLMIDKKQDIQTLANIGASKQSIQQLFMYEGILTTSVGALVGVGFGLLVCWAQLQFGLITMGEGSFVVNQYPVVIHANDVLLVLATVLGIGTVASWLPAWQLGKRLG